MSKFKNENTAFIEGTISYFVNPLKGTVSPILFGDAQCIQ